MHTRLQELNPTITFKLGNNAFDTGNSTNIELPYSAFDLQASKPYYGNATNYFPIRRAANDAQYILGRTFLQEAYLIVDYERKNFTVAQAAFPDPLPDPHIVTITSANSTTTTSTDHKSGLSTAAKVGIGVGAAAALLLLLALFIILRWSKRRCRSELADTQIEPVVETDRNPSDNLYSPVAKPSELGGTQVQELASPVSGWNSQETDKKQGEEVMEPQELDALMTATPVRYELEGGSYMSHSRTEQATRASPVREREYR